MHVLTFPVSSAIGRFIKKTFFKKSEYQQSAIKKRVHVFIHTLVHIVIVTDLWTINLPTQLIGFRSISVGAMDFWNFTNG